MKKKPKILVSKCLGFDKYRKDRVHLSVPVNLLKTYVLRFKDKNLINQTIWEPFPDELLDIADSGR